MGSAVFSEDCSASWFCMSYAEGFNMKWLYSHYFKFMVVWMCYSLHRDSTSGVESRLLPDRHCAIWFSHVQGSGNKVWLLVSHVIMKQSQACSALLTSVLVRWGVIQYFLLCYPFIQDKFIEMQHIGSWGASVQYFLVSGKHSIYIAVILIIVRAQSWETSAYCYSSLVQYMWLYDLKIKMLHTAVFFRVSERYKATFFLAKDIIS